jgi:hypothetical protein
MFHFLSLRKMGTTMYKTHKEGSYMPFSRYSPGSPDI